MMLFSPLDTIRIYVMQQYIILSICTGWLGFGFSPNGNMLGADMIMAWITEDGGTLPRVSTP